MNNLSPKEDILKRIKAGLRQPVAMPFPDAVQPAEIFHQHNEPLAVQFDKEFSRLLGHLAYCLPGEINGRINQFIETYKWQSVYVSPGLPETFPELNSLDITNHADPIEAQVVITECECLIAETGSAVLSAKASHGRSIPIYAPAHIIIATERQLVAGLPDAITFLKMKYDGNWPSMVCFSSGPSRTGDIEKTLVVGVHGPRDVIVILVKDNDAVQ